MPSEGGEPKRLTWHPGGDLVQGWTPERKVHPLLIRARELGAICAPRFSGPYPSKAVSSRRWALPRGFQGKISPDGSAQFAYRMNTSWDDERRNYRGGQNRPVWIVDLKTYNLVSPPWTDSKDIGARLARRRRSTSSPIATASRTSGRSRRASGPPAPGHEVHGLRRQGDRRRRRIARDRTGGIHPRSDPNTWRQKQINITATGDFPWMMPAWEDVSNRLTNMAISPTGRRAVVEARGEIFTIPVEKGDVRNITASSASAERQPSWSPDGKYISYFSDKSGEYKLVLEEPDGLAPPREIALPKPTHYYTPSWSPDSKKLMYSDTNLNVWVLDIATGQPKIVGRDPWMVPERTLNPTWSPDSKWIAYAGRLQSLHHAIFVSNVETGETKQMTDGLADAVWPAWDASGKYLWFLASTDFGLGSQWLDMTSYDHNQTFGLYFAILKKGEPTPLMPESDEDPGIRPGAPGQGRGGAGGRGGQAGDTPARRRRAGAPARACGPRHRADRFRQHQSPHPVRARRPRARLFPPQVRRTRHRLLPGNTRRRRRGHAAALSPERSARGAVRHRASPTTW